MGRELDENMKFAFNVDTYTRLFFITTTSIEKWRDAVNEDLSKTNLQHASWNLEALLKILLRHKATMPDTLWFNASIDEE